MDYVILQSMSSPFREIVILCHVKREISILLLQCIKNDSFEDIYIGFHPVDIHRSHSVSSGPQYYYVPHKGYMVQPV